MCQTITNKDIFNLFLAIEISLEILSETDMIFLGISYKLRHDICLRISLTFHTFLSVHCLGV